MIDRPPPPQKLLEQTRRPLSRKQPIVTQSFAGGARPYFSPECPAGYLASRQSLLLPSGNEKVQPTAR